VRLSAHVAADDVRGAARVVKDLLTKIIVASPDRRLSTAEILAHSWFSQHLGSPPRYEPEGVRAGSYDSDAPIDRTRLQKPALCASARGGSITSGEPEPEHA
jgi:serine/threonine protein kinase